MSKLPLTLTVLAAAVVLGLGIVVADLSGPDAVYLFLGLIALAVVYRYPSASLALFLFASSLKPALAPGLDLTLLTAGLVVLSIMLAVKREGFVPIPSAAWLFAVLALVLAAGVMGSPAPEYGFDKAMRFAMLTPLAVLAALQLIRSPRTLLVFVTSMALIGTLMALSAVVQGGDPAYFGRYTAFGSDTIALGRAAAIAIAAWAVLAMWRKFHVVPAFAGMGLCAWALLGSGNRVSAAGVVAAAAILAAIRLGRSGRPRRVLALAILVLASSAVLVWTMAPEVSIGRYELLLQGVQGDSMTSRFIMFSQAVSLGFAHPIFGIGTGGFSVHSSIFRYPHNSLLEVFSENGIVGLVVYMLLVVASLSRALRESIRHPCFATDFVLSGLVLSLLNALVSSDLNGHRVLYVMIALSLALPLNTVLGSSGESVGAEQRPEVQWE